MKIEETIARIRAYRGAMGWTRARLAAEAGLRDTVLRHFDEPGWNPTATTLRRLETIIPTEWHPPASPAQAAA